MGMEGTLAPQQTAVLKVTCVLDDATLHKDTLTVSVLEGESVFVSLTARGRGTTMYCEESLELLDFSHQFTALKCSRRFLLENKGRRSQTLTWINMTVRDRMAAARAAELKAKALAAEEEKNPKKRKKKKKKKGKPVE